ncbi:MAG: glycosyl transferase [Pelagibacteraceae bacterium TMED124]|nr:MAG: glycosyl transferase [Pelagibacteraceae bacterium TMED124]|tara:strand:+ start:4085 stop:5053 length:969 start_codon:yes stop_codon:yes gene_type:complete
MIHLTINSKNIFVLLGSFSLTFFLIRLTMPIFKKFLLDIPSRRSSHIISKPRGYGIIFVFVGIISCLFYSEYSLLLLIPLTITGFIDDKYNISSKVRYLIQLITVSWILIITQYGNNFYKLFSTDYLLINLFVFIFLIILFTAIINFINFMDGIDGLVAGCMLILIIIKVFLSYDFLLGFVGSLIAFLLWNWSPSKIFMGDSGSTALGTLFVLMLTKNNQYDEILGFFLIGTPLFADALFCLLRRLKNRQNVFTPHKLHLYQRLNQGGLSHQSVSILYIFATSLLGFIWLLFQNSLLMIYLSLTFILVGFWLDKNKAKPFES